MLDEHAENHPRDVKEQIYKSLQSFGQKTDLCSFDFQEFMNILTNNSHPELADMIEKDPRFSPLFPSDSVEGNMSEFNNVSRTQWIRSNCRVYMRCIIQGSSVGHYVPLLYGLILLPCTGRFIVQNVSASFDLSTVFWSIWLYKWFYFSCELCGNVWSLLYYTRLLIEACIVTKIVSPSICKQARNQLWWSENFVMWGKSHQSLLLTWRLLKVWWNTVYSISYKNNKWHVCINI